MTAVSTVDSDVLGLGDETVNEGTGLDNDEAVDAEAVLQDDNGVVVDEKPVVIDEGATVDKNGVVVDG